MKEYDPTKVLERFMKEFFDFEGLLESGFFTKEMREDYEAQAKRVCDYFGYKTVYEYAAKKCRAHLTFDYKSIDKNTPFVIEIKNAYED